MRTVSLPLVVALGCLLFIASSCDGDNDEPERLGYLAFQTDRAGNPEIYLLNLDDLSTTSITGQLPGDASEPAWSHDGTKLAFTGPGTTTNSDGTPYNRVYVVEVDDQGLPSQPTQLEPESTPRMASDTQPAWSNDGKLIAFNSRRDGDDLDIYVIDADVQAPIRTAVNLTDNEAEDRRASFSPDDSMIAFQSNQNNEEDEEIYVLEFDLSSSPPSSAAKRLTKLEGIDNAPDWQQNGDVVAFETSHSGNREVCTLDLGTTNFANMPTEATQCDILTHSTAGDYEAAWSPDGEHIAFVTNRDGNKELYVMDVDGQNQRRVTLDTVSPAASDSHPDWRPSTDGSGKKTPPPSTFRDTGLVLIAGLSVSALAIGYVGVTRQGKRVARRPNQR